MFFDRLFKPSPPKRRPSRGAQSNRKKASGASRSRASGAERRVRQRIAVEKLRIGMFVVELDIPWEESTFMFQGLEIKTKDDITEVQQQCRHVYVDYDARKIKPDDGESAPAGSVKLVDEHSAAQRVHNLASETIHNLFEDIRLGAEIDGGKVQQAVSGCVDTILRNPDASVWLTRIQAKDEGTAQHSLNVAALSIVMAKSLDLSTKELEDVGVCAMLHDVGKTNIPLPLLRKTGPLDAAEQEEMRRHTNYGRDILISTASVMSGAADVAYSHHERPDGQGYPRGLEDQSIPFYARIVSIAEAYDTITSKQPYREARSPSDALQELYENRGTQFDEDLVIKFIDSVGIFPPGSIVELVNGEIGIVLTTTTDKLKPRIIIILNSDKEATAQRVVDLSQNPLDQNGHLYQIKTTHSDGSFDIDIEEFQRAGLRFG